MAVFSAVGMHSRKQIVTTAGGGGQFAGLLLQCFDLFISVSCFFMLFPSFPATISCESQLLGAQALLCVDEEELASHFAWPADISSAGGRLPACVMHANSIYSNL